MAGLKHTDRSPVADAMVLAALFLPFFPVILAVYAGAVAGLAGCDANPAAPCMMAGFDLGSLNARAATLLEWSARAARSGGLLVYIVLLTLLTQFTTQGFRGRVVRTCAVIMWAGILPLVLALADAAFRSPEDFCGGGACTFQTAFPAALRLVGAVIDWIANTAAPLGVLVALLVAVLMSYRLLFAHGVRFLAGLLKPTARPSSR